MQEQTANTRHLGLVTGAIIGLAALLGLMAPAAGAADSGILQLEQRLNDLRYWTGAVDGVHDGDTRQAVMAFQKANGLSATGEATPHVVSAIGSASSPPPPLVANGGPDRVEVDLSRQIVMLYDNGLLAAVLNASTGTSDTPTPPGSYKVYRQVGGWDRGPLGNLYNPSYFKGGFALHGSTSVPAYPASHGCVRISVSAAEWVPGFTPPGTPVYVVGSGPAAARSASSGSSSGAAPAPAADLGYTPITFTPSSG